MMMMVVLMINENQNLIMIEKKELIVSLNNSES